MPQRFCAFKGEGEHMSRVLCFVWLNLAVGTVLACGFQQAKPVWPDGRETERNLFVGFHVTVDDSAATLRYSASSIARVWLNGEFLCYGPARGPHGFDRTDEISLAGLATNRLNSLAFEVAGYNVESYYLLKEPAYLQAEVLDKNGRVIAATGKGERFSARILSERVQKVPRFSYQRPFCEVYRLRPDSTAWRLDGPVAPDTTLAVVEGSRQIARTAPYPDYSVNRTFTPIRRGSLERRTPRAFKGSPALVGEKDAARGFRQEEIDVQPALALHAFTETASGVVTNGECQTVADLEYALYDHGLCDTGFLGCTVNCTKPGRLYFHFDEVLVKGDIDLSRMGWQCLNTLTYDFLVPGEYRIEAFEPNTLRYLKVIGEGFEGVVSGLYVRGYKNAQAKRARFRSSDAQLNAVFEAACETFAQNAVDTLTDCPSRERAGWLCDSFFSGRSERWLCGTNPVERCFLENYALTDCHPVDRFLPMCYPADAGLLPNWNFFLILELEEYLARTGDRKLIDRISSRVRGVIDSFRRYRNEDGLLENLPGWVFLEWSKANELVRDVNYPTNMTYARALEAAFRLYGWVDCRDEAARVRETVRRQSWTGSWFCDNAVRRDDGTLKLSGHCTEVCQYYAFFTGLADEERDSGLWKILVEGFGPQRKVTRKYPEVYFANAFIGNFLRLEILSREGLTRQVLEETKGYLAFMAERTGTLWEHDNVSASCCHGFASHAAVVLFRDVLGVRSVDPLARRIHVRVDRTLPLEFCRGEIPLNNGQTFSFGWRKLSSGPSVEYSLPDATWQIIVDKD